MITAEFEKERKRMKEELKKSLRTYGALLLLGVTGVPLGAAVGLIEALFCRLLLKVTAIRVAHLFWCLPFLAMAGLVIVAVNQKFGGRGKGGMSLIFDVAYEEETELPLCMIPLAMLSTALTHLFGGSAGREGVAVQIGDGDDCIVEGSADVGRTLLDVLAFVYALWNDFQLTFVQSYLHLHLRSGSNPNSKFSSKAPKGV